jgi:cytochrome c553
LRHLPWRKTQWRRRRPARLAGTSPLYIARQFVAFRNGEKDAETSQPMKSVVQALTAAGVLAISAYLASLDP